MLKHVSRTKMGKVDSLSKRPDQKVGTKKDNKNQVFIKDYWIHNLSEVVIEGPEVEIVDKIRKARSKDEEIIRVIEEIKKTRVKVVQGDEWQIEGDLVLKEGKVYIPKDEELRMEIIQLYYDVPAVGHRGKQKMTELVIRNYWWPGVTKDVGKYMEDYDICQKMKNKKAPVGKLMVNEVPEKMWTHLMVDFITKLPLVAGKNAILVVCDRLSKITHFVATIEGILVKGLARLFRDNMWKLHGLPESVISDRDPQFAAELTKKLNRILRIEMRLLTAFHL